MTFSRKRNQAGQAAQQDREQAVFEALFQTHWGRVVQVIARLVGDPAEAEDLALDAFWRLYRQPPRQDQNLAGWLYRVATRLGLNALRARRRRQRYEEAAGKDALQDDPPGNPAILFERAQERQQVRQVLSMMKPRAAQLLVLRHSGMSYAEIAGALDVSTGSIGTLLARAEREFEQRYLKASGSGRQEEEDASQ
ncbi:MAG: sigma-70 family RNA polymerase sigma factor [Anaerolineales bacterium]